jgi:hypothetical protein
MLPEFWNVLERLDNLSREEKKAAERAAGKYDRDYILDDRFEAR